MREKSNFPDDALICPVCGGAVKFSADTYICEECSRRYSKSENGYFLFLPEEDASAPDTTEYEYAQSQMKKGDRLFREYLLPLFKEEPFRRVLEVGCGMGSAVRALCKLSYDAIGVDLPGLGKYWTKESFSPFVFMHARGENLPFKSGYFDIVFSLGVIEHVGTIAGHVTLRKDYAERREAFVKELLRVTRPGGRIILSCPNKSFPIDIQHAPGDAVKQAGKIREWLWNKYSLTFHPVFGKHHLLSYGDVKRLFRRSGQKVKIRALPLKGFFGFSADLFQQRGFFIRKAAISTTNLYLSNLPAFLRKTCFNPYMLAEIKK